MSATKDMVRKQKRPDMAIYTPRGRRVHEEIKASTDESIPSKNSVTKHQPSPDEHVTSKSHRAHPEGNHRPSDDVAQNRALRGPPRRNRRASDGSSEPVMLKEKNHIPPEACIQSRVFRASSEKSQPPSRDTGPTTPAPRNRRRSPHTPTATVNGHTSPSTWEASESARKRPEGSYEVSHKASRRLREKSPVPACDAKERTLGAAKQSAESAQGTADGTSERRVRAKDGTGGRHGGVREAAQSDRDASPAPRRRPRALAAVYVPRGARRPSGGATSDSQESPAGGRPPTDDGVVPAHRDRGDTGEGQPERSGTGTGHGPPPDGRHRHQNSHRSAGEGDEESCPVVSPRGDGRVEQCEVVRKDRAADASNERDDGGRRSGTRRPSREEDEGSPHRAVGRHHEADRVSEPRGSHGADDLGGLSPPRADLAALKVTSGGRSPPRPPARRSALPDPVESAHSTGLLYVPGGGPYSAAPEPPPAPAARHLYDPNNPGQALEVTPRQGDARCRRYGGPARPLYTDDYVCAEPPAGRPDAFGLPSNATNASRISQLLGRAAGEIEYIIATGRLLDAWTVVTRIREHVQAECAALIVRDLRTWMALSVDQTVWKALYYCVIEALRSPEPDEKRAALHQITDDGVEFFSALLNALQSAYSMPVSQLSSLLFDPSAMRRERFFSSVAALSQRLLLCLGDLARYQHQMGRLPNLSQAHSFYLQAQQMNPKNGRPFNQLAIVALLAHRRLDCVYLYARALMASNPFHTAKESLLSLFHEASRRYAARRPLPGQVPAPAPETRPERGGDLRTETWVHPDRGDRLLRTLRSEEPAPECPQLRQTTDAELLRAFTTTYLHVQGKLYTRVSLESYQEDACVMLRQFSELLSREPMPFKTADMLHILGINMFNIANTKLKDEGLGSELRSTYQELALAVAIEMAGHVIQRANQLLSAPVNGGGGGGGELDDRLFLPYSLETCMVFIKVWSDWLLCSSSTWNPPPCTADYRVAAVQDCWASLAELTDRLQARDDKSVVLATSYAAGDTVVRLPEDLYLESFSPLLCASYRTAFVNTERCSLGRARDALRLRCVLFVTEQYLCGTEPAVLRLLKTGDGTCRYISQVSSHEQVGEEAERAGTPELPDVLVEWTRDGEGEEEEEEEGSAPSDLESPPVDDGRPDLLRLRRQKLALERQARKQEEHSRRVAAIVSSAHTSVVLEVRPRYLVADTNCYVDYLEQLQQLVREHTAYTLTVPVTVVAELDGLSRPGGGGRPRPGQSEEHVQQVRRTARAALAFVRQRGAASVRCVTSRGHLLSSAVFTAEDDDDQATNDDRILSCCRNLERGVSEERPDGAHHVSREVVLLTDDRNLRLKAISLDVPTRTVPDFLAWAS